MHLTSLLSIATCLLTIASAAPTPEEPSKANASVENRDRHHCPSGWSYDDHHHGCYRHCDHDYEWDWDSRRCEHRGHHGGHHGHKRDVELEERDRHHCPSGWFYDDHHHGCYRHCDNGYFWDWDSRRCEHRGGHHGGHHGHKRDVELEERDRHHCPSGWFYDDHHHECYRHCDHDYFWDWNSRRCEHHGGHHGGHHGHKRDVEESAPAVEKRETAVELEARDRHHCPSGWFYDGHHHGCYRHCDHDYEWDWNSRRCEHRGGHHGGHHGHKRDVEQSEPAVEKRETAVELEARDRHHCPSGWFYDDHHHGCYRHCDHDYEWDWNSRRCEHRGGHHGGHHGHKRSIEDSSAVEKRDTAAAAVELEARDSHHCPSGWFYDDHHHGCYRHCDHDSFWDWNSRRCERHGRHGGHHGH